MGCSTDIACRIKKAGKDALGRFTQPKNYTKPLAIGFCKRLDSTKGGCLYSATTGKS